MWNFGKAAGLILAASAPVLAVAQATQVRPASQPRPSATPAAGSTTSATPAPAPHSPRPEAAPDSQRFVTSESLFRAGTTQQPAGSAQPAGVQPGSPRPGAAGYASPVQTRPVMPQAAQSGAIVPVPALSAPQPPASLPRLIAPSSANSSGLAGSASVDYARGELTVVSHNASLGAVLKLVAAKTGAIVDLAPELQNEPVVAQLGPSPVRDVLTALLDSPRIDYIVMGTGDGSGGLERLVVRSRRSFGRVAMAPIPRPQSKQQEGEEEAKLDENGNPASGLTPAEAQMTPEQRMENWKKVREEMRQAEIKQQAQDRENERMHPQPEPQPEPQPDPPQPDNPPAR